MNTNEKKIIFVFISTMLFFLFLCVTQVNANSIKEIDMDVYIDENGNATVSETWDSSLSEGTEGYRTIEQYSISNFSVEDETGRKYETINYWNSNYSFDEKAYKCGTKRTSKGVELCWGISNYGDHKYILRYNINNIVTQYKDAQGIYFNFLNIDQSITNNAKIKIHSATPLSIDNSKIWAFGYDGTINFENNYILLNSNGYLSKYEYMVGLIKFETNIFNTKNRSDKTFEEIYNSALVGVTDKGYSTSYKNDNTEPMGILQRIRSLIALIIFNPVTYIVFFPIFYKKKIQSNTLDFGPNGTNLPDNNKIDYWREIPCNKDLERAYWICYKYDIVSVDTLKKGIIGAILLKWIKTGKVIVTKNKKGLFDIGKEEYSIDFTEMTYADNEIENSLLEKLIDASGKNKILEAKEFWKWSEKYYFLIDNWFSKILTYEQDKLEQEGLITIQVKENPGLLRFKSTTTKKIVSPQLREEAIKLKGLKKFLLDFSLIMEREYFEVHMWEEYLIFANLLGIADKVEKQFEKLYPNFNNESLLNTETTTFAIRNMTERCYTEVSRAVERERIQNSSSDSNDRTNRDRGRGGSSYSGGGGSAGGSSGGGFR